MKTLSRIITATLIAGPLMWIAAGVLLWAAASSAIGEEIVRAISLGGFSHHFDRSGDLCEVHPGIGIQYGGNLRRHAGVHTNSECEFSAYGGFSYTREIGHGWRAGGALLAFAGYQKEKKVNGEIEREDKIVLAPFPVLSWEGKHDGIDIGWIPADGLKLDGSLLFIGLKILERVQR